MSSPWFSSYPFLTPLTLFFIFFSPPSFSSFSSLRHCMSGRCVQREAHRDRLLRGLVRELQGDGPQHAIGRGSVQRPDQLHRDRRVQHQERWVTLWEHPTLFLSFFLLLCTGISAILLGPLRCGLSAGGHGWSCCLIDLRPLNDLSFIFCVCIYSLFIY